MDKLSTNKPSLHLVSPIPCSVNHYLKSRAMLIHGKPQVTVYETAEAKQYKKLFKEYVSKEAVRQNWDMPLNKSQHFYCDCYFYFDRIDKDANNYFKLLLDAITETQTIWVDDNVVCERVQGIWYDAIDPHIDIIITPVDYIGVFKNREEHDRFIGKCKTCKRFKDGRCSLYIKSKEGRIQEEEGLKDPFGEKICSKYKSTTNE